jgi:hypothetical protein
VTFTDRELRVLSAFARGDHEGLVILSRELSVTVERVFQIGLKARRKIDAELVRRSLAKREASPTSSPDSAHPGQ